MLLLNSIAICCDAKNYINHKVSIFHDKAILYLLALFGIAQINDPVAEYANFLYLLGN